MFSKSVFSRVFVASALLALGSHEATAQPYPQRPVRLIVPAAAGGQPAEFEAWATDQRQKWIRRAKQANVKAEE